MTVPRANNDETMAHWLEAIILHVCGPIAHRLRAPSDKNAERDRSKSPSPQFRKTLFPLTPGSRTSSIKQLGTFGRFPDRNSEVEVNTSACNPTERIKLLSAPRTEASSSTTNTTGCASACCIFCIGGYPPEDGRVRVLWILTPPFAPTQIKDAGCDTVVGL